MDICRNLYLSNGVKMKAVKRKFEGSTKRKIIKNEYVYICIYVYSFSFFFDTLLFKVKVKLTDQN